MGIYLSDKTRVNNEKSSMIPHWIHSKNMFQMCWIYGEVEDQINFYSIFINTNTAYAEYITKNGITRII